MAKKRRKTNTGVTLEPDVLEYLVALSKREDRDRSWLINSIVRSHAARESGTVKPKAAGSTLPHGTLAKRKNKTRR